MLFWYSKLKRISLDPVFLGPRVRFRGISNFDNRNPIWTSELRTNIVFLTFEIPFRHWNWGRISNFDIRNPILTSELKSNIRIFYIRNPILTFDLKAKYRILTIEILFWHSNWGRISYFYIRNPILIFRPNIEFWQLKSPFLTFKHKPKFRIFTFEVILWHTNWGPISYFGIRNPILTFESYFDIRTKAEYHILTIDWSRIFAPHVKIRYSASVRMSE